MLEEAHNFGPQVPHLGPDAVLLCVKASKACRRELEARGFCRRTFELCLTLVLTFNPKPETLIPNP